MPGTISHGESPARIENRRTSPFLIGVSGGTASGKSTVCTEIMQRLGVDRQPLVIMISQDAFYRELNQEEQALACRGEFNFDHPDALDYKLLLQTLQNLKQGKPVKIPAYNFRTHSRVPEEERVLDPVDVILVEGILIFYYEEIRDMFDIKLFVDTDPDTRLARRVIRDIRDRGRTLDQILHQYLNLVKPAYEEFCLPTKKYADVIIPRGAENQVAIELIVQHIQELLRSPQNGVAPQVHANTNANASHNGGRLRFISDSNYPGRPH